LPSISEVVEQIKALKAAHTVEATPERAGTRRTVAAEEPVTTRIRRRTDAVPAPEPAREPEVAESRAGTSLPPEATPLAIPGHLTRPGAPSQHAGTTADLSVKSERTYQKRAARGR